MKTDPSTEGPDSQLWCGGGTDWVWVLILSLSNLEASGNLLNILLYHSLLMYKNGDDDDDGEKEQDEGDDSCWRIN